MASGHPLAFPAGRMAFFMKHPHSRLLGCLICLASLAVLPGCDDKQSSPESAEVLALLQKMEAAYTAANTLTADFSYTVASDKRQQVVNGQARLMKPNFARLAFSHVAEPAFPNLIASDGKHKYTFVPKNFRGGLTPFSSPINPEFRPPPSGAGADIPLKKPPADSKPPSLPTNRTFEPGSHDPVLAAQQASGLVPGGRILTERVARHGHDLRLWDSVALQSFFHLRSGLNYLYARRLRELKIEGTQVLDGVTYTVISHHYKGGYIEGGAPSDFDQRIFVGPDGLIHRYELRFTSGGLPGIQVMQLRNIRLNEPMTPESFVFTPPKKA
jgi:outer membrane lipoprotein-sorting protein